MLGPRATREDRESFMDGFQGCLCFAVPHKMFRKLLAQAPEAETKAKRRQIKHAHQMRSLRYETPSPPPARSRKLRRNVYDLATTETLPGRLVRTESGKPARDAAANEAFENVGIALAFLREVFGRNSLDGRGMQIDSAIHYGQGFQNAMWNGRQMIIGDGDDTIGGFTASLDIIAHELTHGLTQHLISGGLGVVKIPPREREFKEQKYALRGQSGALNESLSDIFASMVTQWHLGQRSAEADWLIGENVIAPIYGRAIRSLKSPGNRRVTWYDDDQLKSMDHYQEGCDVHDASGIPNHAFYTTAIKMGGHSWQKAGPIWFEAFDSLDASATFADAAEATLQAAANRFGARSDEARAVKAGWRKVKVL
jgi:Zn-dependent metalloprotease